MGCASFEQARKMYTIARAKLGEILSGRSVAMSLSLHDANGCYSCGISGQ